jgi:hypothetical protein
MTMQAISGVDYYAARSNGGKPALARQDRLGGLGHRTPLSSVRMSPSTGSGHAPRPLAD